jgi:hypothetical protein
MLVHIVKEISGRVASVTTRRVRSVDRTGGIPREEIHSTYITLRGRATAARPSAAGHRRSAPARRLDRDRCEPDGGHR